MPDSALLAVFPGWLFLLPLVVPLAVSALKVLNHGVTACVYPLVAVLTAIVVVGASAVVLNLPRAAALWLGTLLGLAGIGVREVVDQCWRLLLDVLGDNGNRPLGLPR